jgi:hypothetical protein
MVMKKVWVLMVMGLFVLPLAACGGGGGGSGTAGKLTDNAVIVSKITQNTNAAKPVNEVTDSSEVGTGTATVIENGVDLGDGIMLKKGSLELLKNGTTIAKFQTEANGDVALYDIKNNDRYMLASKSAADIQDKLKLIVPSDVLDGIVASTVSVLLNAGAVPLQHSTYGAWMVAAQNPLPSGDRELSYYVPVQGGTVLAPPDPDANNFTGKAQALASTAMNPGHIPAGGPRQQFITGTASLDIDAKKLELMFPDFYEIVFNNITDSGGFQFSGNFNRNVPVPGDLLVSVTDLSKDPDYHLGASPEYAHVEGGFYGNEAVGTFGVDAKTAPFPDDNIGGYGDGARVQGSFGVTLP